MRGQLVLIAVIALGTIALGVTVSYACGLAPLPEPPKWRPGVSSR